MLGLIIGPAFFLALVGGWVALAAVKRPHQPIRSRAASSLALRGWHRVSSSSGSALALGLLAAPMAVRAWKRSSSGSRGAGAGVAGLVLVMRFKEVRAPYGSLGLKVVHESAACKVLTHKGFL